MLTLLTPFKSLACWFRKLRGTGALRTAEAVDGHAQESCKRDAGAGEQRTLAGKWPEQTDVVTRLNSSGRVVRLNGGARDNNDQVHKTRMHRNTRTHNVYKFPEM